MNVDRHFPSAGNTVELCLVYTYTLCSVCTLKRGPTRWYLSRSPPVPPSIAYRFHRGFPSRANHSPRFLVNARPRHVANHADRLYNRYGYTRLLHTREYTTNTDFRLYFNRSPSPISPTRINSEISLIRNFSAPTIPTDSLETDANEVHGNMGGTIIDDNLSSLFGSVFAYRKTRPRVERNGRGAERGRGAKEG